jgi:PD-(D/E)XK nuclease superfamily
MRYLSLSKLSALSCPRRYTLEYLRREPTLAPFASSVFGSQVHADIQAQLAGQPPPSRRLPARLLLHPGTSLDRFQARAEQAMHTFTKLRPGLIEVFAELPLDGVTLRLRVDYLYKRGGTLQLVDWKTGADSPARLQLGTYLSWAHHAFGTTRAHGQVVNLSNGHTTDLAYSAALDTEVRSHYQVAARQLDHLDADITAPGPACRYCPYAWSCPAVSETSYGLLNTRDGTFVPGHALRALC